MAVWASLPDAAYVAYLDLGAQQHDALGTFLATLKRAGLHAHARYVVGIPGAELGKIAAADTADLIVMGSHGHSGFKKLLFGSVTMLCWHRALHLCWSYAVSQFRKRTR